MPRIASGSDFVESAVTTLRSGGLVAFPTETVYGLGADTFNANALDRIYRLKGRPLNNPLIAHVLDVRQAKKVSLRWDAHCQTLAEQFWPGPLTIVIPKSESVPSRATAGYSTIAVRSPSHEVARELLKAFDGPISAPSANRSGHVSPTRAEHVAEDFRSVRGAEELLILDGGPSSVGIESTVLDLSQEQPRILRPGSISAEALASALGSRISTAARRTQSASPGTAPAHYAPRTPAELLDSEGIASRLASSPERFVVLTHHQQSVAVPHSLLLLPPSPEGYASELYDSLRRADAMGAAGILIEAPNEGGPLWDAIRNRLARASSHQSGTGEARLNSG